MWHGDARPSHNVGLMNIFSCKEKQFENPSVSIGHRKKRPRNSLQPWNKQIHQHKKQIKPSSAATAVADGSNVCCSSLSLPPCRHTQDRQKWLSAIFSTLVGNVGRQWEPQQSSLPPGFPTCAGCSLPFIISILPALGSSCTPVSPQLCWCCWGWPFLAPLLGAVAATLPSHTVWELKRQQWAASSTAGHKMLLSGCVHLLIPSPQELLLCRGPGEALHVWVQPYAELQCGCHQQSTDGSKP